MNEENKPTKTTKLSNKKNTLSKLDKLKSLDEEVKKYLSKKEKFEFTAKELSFHFYDLLSEKNSDNINQKDFENNLLKSILDFATKLNEDPDYPNDYGTFSLLTLFFKSLILLKNRHSALEEKYNLLLSEVNALKNVDKSRKIHTTSI